MGLFQKAVETYDAMVKDHAGVYKEGQKEPLAPIGHIIANAKIQITINQNGKFQEAIRNEDRIIIPATIESANRTSGIGAHPLCETIAYISPNDQKKHQSYITQLSAWEKSDFSHPMLKPILSYVNSRTIIDDLAEVYLINNEKDLICWRVVGIGNESGNCWENKNLMKAFQDYYIPQIEKKYDFCMISGGKKELLCTTHIKGIVSHFGNAKLISSNDNKNYTYRGRFTDDQQACTVSYESSQKAHNALKWLIANEGVVYGGRTFLCWNPNGKNIPKPRNSILFKNDKPAKTPTDYKEQLKDAIAGWKKELELPAREWVIIAVFDAPAKKSGRLSINYYNELMGSDFLDRLKYWDETCCWYHYQGISSPTLRQIASYAFGTLRSKGEKTSVEIDDKVLGQQIQRLLMCRVDKSLFPFDIFQALIQKASNLQIYESNDREKLLFITCAVIKKYKYDHYKETIEMSLESDRKDRSYQYGRLIAILEKIEKDTYKRGEERESNIIRRLSTFIKTPLKVSADIMTQLKSAYYPQLSSPSRTFYDKLIGEIMEIIDQLGDKDKPLSETYIIGYYLQQKELYKSNKNNTNNTEEQNNAQ